MDEMKKAIDMTPKELKQLLKSLETDTSSPKKILEIAPMQNESRRPKDSGSQRWL